MVVERSYQRDRYGDEDKRDEIALCLSGGGYRAMLFHTGALLRLNEAGILSKADRISTVSGGSIAAGLLGLMWKQLGLDTPGAVSPNFADGFIAPVRRLAGQTIDIPAILKSMLRIQPVGNYIADDYDRLLFDGASIQSLPEWPLFILNTTNMLSGVNMRFTRKFIWDYRVGKVDKPQVKLSIAVAASSAFPPFLSPVRPRFKTSDFVPGTGMDLQHPPFTTDVTLADGGVYDNMGLEALKGSSTILASNGGGTYSPVKHVNDFWPVQFARVFGITTCQARGLRLRQLIADYLDGVHEGTYWGIATDITNYKLADSLPCPHGKTMQLAKVPTRLMALSKEMQEKLINWGYAVCDTAIRKHYDSTLPAPGGFPYDVGVG